jgi:hypothetical protein
MLPCGFSGGTCGPRAAARLLDGEASVVDQSDGSGASVDDAAFAEKQREFVGRLPQRYHSQGSRPKVIELPGGVRVTVSIPYFHRQKDPAKIAAKPGRGLFPALMLLGIVKGRTPHVRQRMVKSAALLGSFEEAAEMLADSCVNVSVNALREVCGHVGQRLAQLTSSGNVAVEEHVGGRRIVVSLDGGRVRLREPRKGRTKKGRKRFSARWREPRLFIIYAVDENGRMAGDFPPIIDGTLASCDRLFEMLQAFLVSLGITAATRILFVADGAAWIWRRIPKLIKALELKAEQVLELIDFWHAVEYLGKIAESVNLTGSKRKHWLTTQKKRLIRGEIGAVVDETGSQPAPTWSPTSAAATEAPSAKPCFSGATVRSSRKTGVGAAVDP